MARNLIGDPLSKVPMRVRRLRAARGDPLVDPATMARAVARGFDVRTRTPRTRIPLPPPIMAAPQNTTPQALAQSQSAEAPAMNHRQALAVRRNINIGAAPQLSLGGLLRGAGSALSGLIPGGGLIQQGVEGIIGRISSGGTRTVSGPGTAVGCPQGLIKLGNTCVDVGAAFPGGDPLFSPAGGGGIAPGGRSRPGVVGGTFAPMAVQTVRRECGPDHILGWDGMCYPKRGFPNRDRMWPKGRAPLLTGGERNAITTANRAAKKIERTTKQLQRMGMIKKPNPRRRIAPRAAAMRQITPGTSIVNVE